jgi:DNA polymerase
MKSIPIAPSFEAWRLIARDTLRAGFHPSQLDLHDTSVPAPLSLALEPDEFPAGPPLPHPHASPAFLDAARLVAAHRDPQRWNLLYRILFRLQSRRDLLQQESDEDILQLTRLEAQVRRDLHAMQAFLRFRKILDPTDPTLPEDRPIVRDEPIPFASHPHAHHLVLETPTPFGPLKTELETCPPAETSPGRTGIKDCDHFLAWYRPEHRILPLAAPFFAERFAAIRWTILTPGDGDSASVSWDPIAKRLIFGPGVPRDSASSDPPEPGELEALWRSYYAGLFNPMPSLATATQQVRPK